MDVLTRGVGNRIRVILTDITGAPMTTVTGATFCIVPADEQDVIANAIGPDSLGAYSWALAYNASATKDGPGEDDSSVAGAYDGTLPQEVGAMLLRSKNYRVVPLKTGLISSAPETFSVR